ncbi:MAG TPA: amidohydrolase family protein [Dehalococcoidia bacterium]|nr:amidohydrolase family protein [Dehalococcoidia bacterium]
MPYDLIIKNGRIVDGSGMPSFRGDVGVRDGKIVEVGKVDGEAGRVINADGLAISPGFIDNHTHYDAQVTWDPLCTSSCYHGVTSVMMGHCGLALAPARPDDQDALAQMLSRIEAIPIDALRAGIRWEWETIPQYLNAVDRQLGVNVGALIGHSAVRRWVLGADASEREATPDEITAMRQIVREAVEAGAIGFSTNQNVRHIDYQGRPVPSVVAPQSEILALTDVFGELGTGVIQTSDPGNIERNARMSQEISRRTGRPVVWLGIFQTWGEPNKWQELLNVAADGFAAGARAYPMASPRRHVTRFNLLNAQIFDGLPSWLPISLASPEEKVRAYRDPEVRVRLREEAVVGTGISAAPGVFSRRWDLLSVAKPQLPKNQALRGKSIAQIATERGADILDTFLDLALEENLETGFEMVNLNGDDTAVAQILTSPYVLIGLADSGAHVVFDAGYGFCTRLLGYWVREKGVMSLEEAVRKLTFMTASIYGLHDRGLIRPGLVADLVVFDPDTVAAREPEVIGDLPGGGERLEQKADGILCTVVNGQVLIEDNQHTGALPGRVLRNSRYQATNGA